MVKKVKKTDKEIVEEVAKPTPVEDFVEEITSRRGKTIIKRIFSDGRIEEL